MSSWYSAMCSSACSLAGDALNSAIEWSTTPSAPHRFCWEPEPPREPTIVEKLIEWAEEKLKKEAEPQPAEPVEPEPEKKPAEKKEKKEEWEIVEPAEPEPFEMVYNTDEYLLKRC
ncbi:unnamed protein product [Caenorhabditis sp. 36 PRJEB53466]|nr:unnamed protein product [Caenorhabditis sp. 36 PRJEB53466]